MHSLVGTLLILRFVDQAYTNYRVASGDGTLRLVVAKTKSTTAEQVQKEGIFAHQMWVHMCMVYQADVSQNKINSDMKLYVNGELAHESTVYIK